jgi:hypothetical protein
MAQITIKLDGIQDVHKLFKEKGEGIIGAGQRVIEEHNKKIIALTVSKIKNKTGEMASLLKSKVNSKGRNYVAASVGTLDATKEQAIAWNAYEYGHAAPGDAGGTKIVQGSKVLRSSVDEDKASFRNDMKIEIKKVIEG